jgi:hypothetical protein
MVWDLVKNRDNFTLPLMHKSVYEYLLSFLQTILFRSVFPATSVRSSSQN